MLTRSEVRFFEGFHGFCLDRQSTRWAEFLRLATQRNWETQGKTYRKHLKKVKELAADCDGEAVDLAAGLNSLNINAPEQTRPYASKSVSVQAAFGKIAAHHGLEKQPGLNHTAEAIDASCSLYVAEIVHAHYGSNETKLDLLQQLCLDLGLEPIPGSVTKCKEMLKTVHVNIYTFLNCKEKGQVVAPVFDDYKEFRKYSRKNDLIFKKKHAKESPILKFLLEKLR